MTKPLTLTDTQLILLSAATQREDHLLSPPDHLKGGAAKAVTAALLAASLVEEVLVGCHDPHWHKDEEDQLIGLRITTSGLAAIGIQGEDDACATEEPMVSGAPPQPREGTKRALVITLLSREQGASIDVLTTATGWLPHTTRAALTGLRQSGYAITRTRSEDNRTVYRLTSSAESASPTVAPEPAEV